MSDRTCSTRPQSGIALFVAACSVLAAVVTPTVARAAESPAVPSTPLVLAHAQLSAPAPVEWAAVRYVPEPQVTKSRGQIHGGVYDPESDLARRAIVGLRGGPMLTRNLQIGLGADWMYDSQNLTTSASGITGPGGTPIGVQQVISRASLHQIPVMAFAQFEGWGLLWLVPYVGASGGYQFMVITADNYATNQHFDATLGGWAWQTWAGVGLPMGNNIRLTGEVFVHGGDVSRNTSDSVTGIAFRETAPTDGVGARFGLSWGK
jgi:hypothetical protein